MSYVHNITIPDSYSEFRDVFGCDTVQVNKCCTKQCAADSGWEEWGTGYERQTTQTLSSSCSCETYTYYRCAAGYYGSSTDGVSGCTICPDGSTSVAGKNTTISSCCKDAGVLTMTGNHGKYICGDKTCWSE